MVTRKQESVREAGDIYMSGNYFERDMTDEITKQYYLFFFEIGQT